LLAASFVLAVILVETGGLYRQLAGATAQLETQARELALRVQQRTEELTQANRLLSAILESSPVAIMMRDPDGKVVLLQLRESRDPESGGRYTVKRFKVVARSGKRITRVRLEPNNREFSPMVLDEDPERELKIIAEFLEVLVPAGH